MQAEDRPREIEYCSWQEIATLVHNIAATMQDEAATEKYDCILAITNGGIIPARLLAEELGIARIILIPVHDKKLIEAEMPTLQADKKYLVVDDIYDTGEVYQMVAEATRGYDCTFVFCLSRSWHKFGLWGKLLNHNRWIVFPWERPLSS